MYGIFILCPLLILQHWRSRQLGPEPHFLESHCIVRTLSLLSIVAPMESFFWIFRFSKSDRAPKGRQPKMMSFFTLSLTCYSPLALSSLSSWLVVLTVFLTALKIHKMPKIHNNPLTAEGTIQLQFDFDPPLPQKTLFLNAGPNTLRHENLDHLNWLMSAHLKLNNGNETKTVIAQVLRQKCQQISFKVFL